MQTRDQLHHLAHLQDRVVADVKHAAMLLRTKGEAARPELASRRWAMMRLLREYQLFKHVKIFDPVIASGNPAQVALAKDMKARCIAGGEAYTAYVARWSSIAVDQQWPAYVLAMREMTAGLLDHVAREKQEFVRLLRDPIRTGQSKAAIGSAAA